MQVKALSGTVLLTAVLTLSACSSTQGDKTDLMRLRATDGPDEFAILPPKALEMPKDLASLPIPTPGGANLTDPRPLDDAITALGGKPNGGTTDAGLAAYAGRMGTDPSIRRDLAAKDLEFRQKNKGRFLERLFGLSSYNRVYKAQQLNQQAELDFWRAQGLKTPSAPPKGYDAKADKRAQEKAQRQANEKAQ